MDPNITHRPNDPIDTSEATAAVETLYAVGHRLLQAQRVADAADVFRLMLRVAPQDDRSWLALGDCHERVGHLQVALELYSTGTIVAEPSVRCLAARARVLHELGRFEDADDCLSQALELAEAHDDHELAAQLRTQLQVWS